MSTTDAASGLAHEASAVRVAPNKGSRYTMTRRVRRAECVAADRAQIDKICAIIIGCN